ncbi:MAG: hypothetical protein HY700_07315 [Gemmatimonadetes bacterium]|nr:hypothetical protein [Gemmatimonadota bacterium]
MEKTAWLAACLLSGPGHLAAAQTPQAAKLAGLPEAVHVVVTVDSLARAAGIDEDSLQRQVESRLHDAGFSIMTVFGGSYLIVEVHAFQVHTTTMLVYDVGLEYHTFAIPARQLSAMIRGLPDRAQISVSELAPLVQRSVDVALYRRAVYGVGARNNAGAVANVVTRNLQVFLSDFRSVNPPGR